MVADSNSVAVTYTSDFAPASSKEFLDIYATIECGFALKRVRDMIRTYSHLLLLCNSRAIAKIIDDSYIESEDEQVLLDIKIDSSSSIVIEAIGTVLVIYAFIYLFIFYERYFKCKKHKQKHLSNIQPDISKQKSI